MRSDHDYWQGNGFKIETPKMPVILIVRGMNLRELIRIKYYGKFKRTST